MKFSIKEVGNKGKFIVVSEGVGQVKSIHIEKPMPGDTADAVLVLLTELDRLDDPK